ncbi:MAG: tetratricopeptide repeat protein [Sphingobacteriales bacterium]|nr:MAG: tetratricopeptide repeat protein [Sphingobacteriales bacterium]
MITRYGPDWNASGYSASGKPAVPPGSDAVFTNKAGAKVGWHPITSLRHDKWFDFTYYGDAQSSVMFAQTFANATAPTEAQLRIGVSGSVKVWVNDALVLTEPEERNNDLDSYIQTIKLNTGYNRILVQIGESYAGSSNFLVRITDDKGHVIPLTYSAAAQPYTKETGYVSKKIEPFGITFFENAVKNDPEDHLAKILLSQAYLRNDKTYDARRIIEQLRAKYPNSTFLNLLLLNVFNREDNRTGAETLKEAIKNNDPDQTEALMYKYNELIAQKDNDKALAIINRLQEKQPEQQEFIYAGRITLAGLNNNQDEIIRLGEEAYLKYPDNKQFVTMKYIIEKQVRKNPKAINYLKKYVDNNDDYVMLKELSDAYFTSGDAATGIKILQEEINNKPYAPGIYANLGNQYFDLQKYDKAEENYLNSIRIAPTISNFYSSLGKINEMAGRKDKAVDYYKKTLSFYPNDYQTIQSLRTLQSKKDVFSYFGNDTTDEMIRKAPKAADYPEDEVVVLNDEVQKVVYEQGGSEERHIIVVKALTQKGVENWKEYQIGYDGWQNLLIETAEVIKANGSKVPAERNDNSLVFTNLEVGDIMNIRYKICRAGLHMGLISPRTLTTMTASRMKKMERKTSGTNWYNV